MAKISIRASLSDAASLGHYRAHKAFLLANYALLGAASSCIFLTISLRLVPSACGFLFILLHVLTIAGAIASCAAASNASSGSWHGAHLVGTVLTAILQGAVAVLVFTRTSDFLTSGLKSYVREDDGVVILRMVGGLGVGIFCMEWVVMALAFVLRYYDLVEGDCTKAYQNKQQQQQQHGQEEMGNWSSWQLQV